MTARGATAAGLALLWTLLGCWLARGLIAGYFPLGDEWALLAAADPAISPVSAWFTSGFTTYFVDRPELIVPYTNFVRPAFNAMYWLLGAMLAPESGARLVLNALALGGMSALAWLAMIRGGAAKRPALLLALVLPLMPSLLPALAGMYPFLAYDPLTACLCLGVYLGYQAGYRGCSIALLFLAVLMKETALPMAAALPLHYLLSSRADDGRRWTRCGLLALPLLLWIALRLLSFGDLTGGTYTTGQGLGAMLHGIAEKAQRWPLWVLRAPASAGAFYKLSQYAMVAANIALVLAGAWMMLRRLIERRNLDLAEWVLVFSYGLMLLAGVYARFGAVLDAFLVISIARWLQESPGKAPRAAAAALALGLACYAMPAWQVLHSVPAQLQPYYDVGRDYTAALRALPAGRRVLVLNDPVTWHARIGALRAVERLPVSVEKLADFTCPTALKSLEQPCTVSLTPTGERSYEFAQSCGVSICGAKQLAAEPKELRIAEARVLLPAAKNAMSSTPLWERYRFELDRGDLDLMYFDPATRRFVVQRVP